MVLGIGQNIVEVVVKEENRIKEDKKNQRINRNELNHFQY